MMQDDIEENADLGPSKSELKRQSHDLQALGEALIVLPQAELDELPLPEILRDAVMLARRITAHGGLYRQKQFIGKLMRKIDAEPIRIAIEAKQELERTQARQFQMIERWRARLIDAPDTDLNEFTNAYPNADRGELVRLIAQARHERASERTPKAARELFKAIEKAIKRES